MQFNVKVSFGKGAVTILNASVEATTKKEAGLIAINATRQTAAYMGADLRRSKILKCEAI